MRAFTVRRVITPDNVMLLYQPPYSPQVKSSEQLWQWSKGEIANTLFANIEHLKTTLNHLFQSKSNEFFASLTAMEFVSDASLKISVLPTI